MIKLNFRVYNPQKDVEKSKLYKIVSNGNVQFIEEQENGKDIVNMEYCLENEQYGIFAKEYRRPDTLKDGGKVADVLACIIDEEKKRIYSLIFDVKRDISAFSDDLTKPDAMIVAIKEVRDFIKQIRAEILHKESFLLYYKDEGYVEKAEVGIVTSSFEPEKFQKVSERLQFLLEEGKKNVSSLVNLKLMNNLRAYVTEVKTLRDFSEKRIVIGSSIYPLQVYDLQKKNELEYEANIKICFEE